MGKQKKKERDKEMENIKKEDENFYDQTFA